MAKHYGKMDKYGSGSPPSVYHDYGNPLVDSVLENFGLFGKPDKPPTDFAGNARNRLVGDLRSGGDATRSKYADAANLLDALGHPEVAATLRHYAGGVGGTMDFGPNSEFSVAEANGLRDVITRANRVTKGGYVGSNEVGFRAKLQELLQEHRNANDQIYYDKNIEPALASAQGEYQHELDTPQYGQSDVATMKSRSAAQIVGATESRARANASLFGMSGMTTGSPAMTAITERAAREASDQLSGALNSIEMSTTQANRASAGEAAQGLAALSTGRQQARSALQAGDRGALYSAQNNTNGILAALNAQREARQAQDEAQSAALDAEKRANAIKYGTAALGVVAAPFTGGASLGITAGALGGLAGGGRKTAATPQYGGIGGQYDVGGGGGGFSGYTPRGYYDSMMGQT